MRPGLHPLSLITATVLLCLTSPTQRLKIPLGIAPALAQEQTSPDQSNDFFVLFATGVEQYDSGQFQDALKTFEQVLTLVRAIAFRQFEGVTLYHLGLTYGKLGQDSQALTFHEQALAIAKDTGDRPGEAANLNSLGAIHSRLGAYPQALTDFEQALAQYQALGDKEQEGATLNHLGMVYIELDQYSQALEVLKQALAIHQAASDRQAEGTTLNNLGLVHSNLGQYAQALKAYEQALAIAQERGDRVDEGIMLNNLGLIYGYLGQDPQASQFFEQALTIAQASGDKAFEGLVLNNLGAVQVNLQQYAEALTFFAQALKIAQALEDRVGEGLVLNNTGLVYSELEQYSQALQFYERALTIRQTLGDRNGEGTTLSNIGSVYDDLGQYSQSLATYEQALAIAKAVGDKAGEGVILNNMGAVYRRLGQNAAAAETLAAAIKIWESLRPGLTDANKVSIFETQAHTYRLLQQALVAQDQIGAALEIAERGRARAFVELFASRLAESAPSQPPITSPTLPQIQQIAKEQNATLVEYSVVKDVDQASGQEDPEIELFIWVVKPTGEVAFRRSRLKALDLTLEELVFQSRTAIGILERSSDAIASSGANPTERLQQLYQLLIAPIADLLPQDPTARVVFIPQDSLFLVPFPALQDPEGNYLIANHTLLTAPAIQVLALTRQRGRAVERGVLVVGNPTMPALGDPPLPLPSLPGAETEALTIAQLLNTQALVGDQATEAAVVQQLPSARIVHLATHGILIDLQGQGAPGAIALAPSGTDNGLLTAEEILKLKLNADLVVLSACDTGRGRITGDGVIGLSRSLISAGATSAIVSLWGVSDDATALLMTELYRQLVQTPDKAQALRQAMLVTQTQYPDPLDWAAFTLIGEAQ